MSADSLSECVEMCCSNRVKFSAMLAAAVLILGCGKASRR